MRRITTVKNLALSVFEGLGLNATYWMNKALTLHGKRMLTNRRFRERQIVASIEEFNGHIGPKAPKTTRVFSIWEEDRRLIWLNHAADLDSECEVYHVKRGAIFRGVFDHLMRNNLKGDPRHGESDIEVYYGPGIAEARKSFRQYCREAMIFIRDRYGVDVWFMPKLNDGWIIDVIMALRQMDELLVANDREGHIFPQRMSFYPPVLRNYVKDFQVDRLCLTNRGAWDFWIKSGFDSNKMVMTGKPCSDYWNRKDLWNTRSQIHPDLSDDRFLILYFSFGTNTLLNFYFPGEKRNWNDLNDAYHEVLLHILRKYHHKIQLVYKIGMKSARDYYHKFDEFEAEVSKLPDNKCFVKLGGAYSSLELMRNADAVVGFMTTGLIEAMFTDNPIIFGAWGQLYDDIKDRLFAYHKTKALIYAQSQEDLRSHLEDVIEGRGGNVVDEEVLKARRKFREEFYFGADGNVSKRILNEAKDLVRARRDAALSAPSTRQKLI
jgi:hypothetical protein